MLCAAISDLPQGSNFRPSLFLLHINDLLSFLTCGSLIYVNDNKFQGK